MSDANKTVMGRVYEAVASGDFDALDALIADDLIEHEELPGFEPTKDGVLEFFRQLRAAFPDLVMTPQDMVSEGDRVSVRGTMTGTHRGEFMGIPATDNRIEVAFADFLRLEDGRLAEHWGLTDTETMMRQLGVMDA